MSPDSRDHPCEGAPHLRPDETALNNRGAAAPLQEQCNPAIDIKAPQQGHALSLIGTDDARNIAGDQTRENNIRTRRGEFGNLRRECAQRTRENICQTSNRTVPTFPQRGMRTAFCEDGTDKAWHAIASCIGRRRRDANRIDIAGVNRALE